MRAHLLIALVQKFKMNTYFSKLDSERMSNFLKECQCCSKGTVTIFVLMFGCTTYMYDGRTCHSFHVVTLSVCFASALQKKSHLAGCKVCRTYRSSFSAVQ